MSGLQAGTISEKEEIIHLELSPVLFLTKNRV
jgi:hypothetical protein